MLCSAAGLSAARRRSRVRFAALQLQFLVHQAHRRVAGTHEKVAGAHERRRFCTKCVSTTDQIGLWTFAMLRRMPEVTDVEVEEDGRVERIA